MRAFAALAIFCALSLAINGLLIWRLSSAGDEIDRLTITVADMRKARQSDSAALSVRDQGYQEARGNAQAKYDAIHDIPDGLLDADWLDALRRGLRLAGGDGGADTTGKPDAANATPGATGGADAH